MANTLFILSDEHNPKVTSIHGHPRVETPTLARMAAEGTVFDNAYCPSPLCLPARSAWLCGRRVHEIQTYNNSPVNLCPEPESFGHALHRQGVYAGYMGKVDGYKPRGELGFTMMGEGGDRTPPGDTNFLRKPLAIREGAHRRAEQWGPRDDAFAVEERLLGGVLDWIENTAPGLDRPWCFTYACANVPHFPHFVTPELWARYEGCDDLPAHGPECASAQHPRARDLRDHFECDLFSEENVRGLRRGYLGCVTWVDRAIGRVVEALERTGQLANTNVIYSSDHGEMLGKFGMWWKCTLYEDSVRVPLVAMGPDFAAGKRVRTLVDLHDARATFFDAAGLTQPEGWLGTPLARIPEDDPTRTVFSEYHGHGGGASSYMIRRGDWKLIHHCGAPHQLFDLAKDPEELENLYDASPEIAAALERELRAVCDPDAENERAYDFQNGQAAAIGINRPGT